MKDLIHHFNKKVDGIIWHLISTGVVLLLLAVLIVWTDFMVKLAVGLFVLVVAYMFFYFGYRLWAFKQEIKKYL